MGEWKVAPFRRTMLVLRASPLDSRRVTGVRRGLEDMLKCGVDESLWGSTGAGHCPLVSYLCDDGKQGYGNRGGGESQRAWDTECSVVPACAWTWGGGIGQSGEKGRKAASTSTPSKRETRQETGTDRRNWCDIRLLCSGARTGGKPRARCSMRLRDGSRLGQSAALVVSTRA